MRADVCGVFHDYHSSMPAGEKELYATLLPSAILISIYRLMSCGHNVVWLALNMSAPE